MRSSDLILATGPAADNANVMVNPGTGGQFGWARQLKDWVADTPDVPMQPIYFLLESPRGFGDMSDPETQVAILKNLIEARAEVIEGIDMNITTEVGSKAFGADGQQFEFPTRSQITPAAVSITWAPTLGRGIRKFWKGFHRDLMPNTETGYIGTVMSGAMSYEEVGADYYTFSILGVRPDSTMTKVVEAAIAFNLFPRTNGGTPLRRAPAEALEPEPITMEFGGLLELSDGVDALGQVYLDNARKAMTNPNTRISFLADESVRNGAADIEAVGKGFLSSMGNVAE